MLDFHHKPSCVQNLSVLVLLAVLAMSHTYITCNQAEAGCHVFPAPWHKQPSISLLTDTATYCIYIAALVARPRPSFCPPSPVSCRLGTTTIRLCYRAKPRSLITSILRTGYKICGAPTQRFRGLERNWSVPTSRGRIATLTGRKR